MSQGKLKTYKSLTVLTAFLVCAFMGLVLSLTAPARADEEEQRIQAIEKASKSVVSVRTYRESGQKPGIGSGVIINPKGYILTNAHVVKGGNTIKVQLKNKKTFEASVYKLIPDKDLAVLKINSQNLPAAKIGNSHHVRVGQTVIAIGDPLGFTGTVTVGMVSGLNRNVETKGIKYADLIQTDAAINPGSSGGALINLHGELVGINALVYTGPSSGYDKAQGLGFAIPIATALKVTDNLMQAPEDNYQATSGDDEEEETSAPRHTSSKGHAWIGLSGESITRELANDYGITPKSGVLIKSVTEGGPAHAAKLRKFDCITAINGNTIYSVKSMQQELARCRVGQKVKLTVWRNNKRFSVPVTLQAR